MRATKVSARWTGEGMNYIGVDSKGREVLMGHDHMSPGQLLLLASAGCMGLDVLHVLKKKHQDVTDVQVDLVGYQPDTYPKPYQNVELNFIVKGNNLNPIAVERAIDLSKDKYCVVNQTLMQNTEVTTTYVLEESG